MSDIIRDDPKLIEFQLALRDAETRGDLNEIKLCRKELREYMKKRNSHTVPRPEGTPMDATKTKKKKKTTKKDWSVAKRTSAIWLKFYADQLGLAPDASVDDQIAALRGFLDAFVSVAHPYNVHAIVHYKDTNLPKTADEKWKPSAEKPHCHLLVFYTTLFADGHRHKIRVETLLNQLSQYNLNFRPGTDDAILFDDSRFPDLRNHEECRIITYHTHETYDARVTDGKELYDRDECYTNLSPDDLKTYYDFYFTNMDNSADKKRDIKAPTLSNVEHYINLAQQHGLDGGDFDDFWFTLPGSVRVTSGLKAACWDAYDHGIDTYLNSFASVNHTRCAIYIFGAGNVGKSYTAEVALKNMGLKTATIDAGGTGKTDDLRPSHQALVVNDTALKDILGMADDRFCKVWRRNSRNPLFTGDYYVITHNIDLSLYLKRYYTHSIVDQSQREAVFTRFFLCRCDADGLHLIRPGNRGDDKVETRIQMFAKFQEEFNKVHATYKPKTADDINALLDKYGIEHK